MTGCVGIDICATGFAHAAFTAAAYVLTTTSTVLLIRIAYVYRRRHRGGVAVSDTKAPADDGHRSKARGVTSGSGTVTTMADSEVAPSAPIAAANSRQAGASMSILYVTCAAFALLSAALPVTPVPIVDTEELHITRQLHYLQLLGTWPFALGYLGILAILRIFARWLGRAKDEVIFLILVAVFFSFAARLSQLIFSII
ncbi:hypothetical protein [Burkholderia territorii]|uniref:hypothetical protein n=1 Tax=Burkholderia territorii TaxID=1503055 RepID=UPI0012D95B7D|nr:hypothetical protein [Burkholderia territorii]